MMTSKRCRVRAMYFTPSSITLSKRFARHQLAPKKQRPGRCPAVQQSRSASSFSALRAQDLADADALGSSGLAQYRDAGVRVIRATHENVECAAVTFSPASAL